MMLYKTTIVIWTDYNASQVELEDLAIAATVGDAYCSKQECVKVEEPFDDPNPPSPEFFGVEEEEEEEEEEE